MLDPVIVDASAWLAVLLQEVEAPAVEPILERHPLIAPELIRYETANGLLFARKRKRLIDSGNTFDQLLSIIYSFPIQILPINAWWSYAVYLVNHYDLTFYDASYIGTAKALGLPLLTLDENIIKVMEQEKIAKVL